MASIYHIAIYKYPERTVSFESFTDKTEANTRAVTLMHDPHNFLACWTPGREIKFYNIKHKKPEEWFLTRLVYYGGQINITNNPFASLLFDKAFAAFTADEETGEIDIPGVNCELYWANRQMFETDTGKPYTAWTVENEDGDVFTEFITAM